MPIERIAISTGGGDAPGLNAVIRSIVLSAVNRGWKCFGIRDGYNGLLLPEQFPQGGLLPLSRDSVRGITHLGGTILGTTNRGDPMRFPTTTDDGRVIETDRTAEVVSAFRRHRLDALVAIGGDGSLAIAAALFHKGLRVIGVPKTIDNDLDKTVVTFGFDTAVHFATECIDRLHSTAEAHQRIMVVEVMGRYAGWIALNSGVSATADAILIPEIPFDIHKVAEKVMEREHSGRRFSIIVAAEGARPKGGKHIVAAGKTPGRAERLGGIGQAVCSELAALTGKEARTVVLGHLLRGGTPTSFDRLLSLRFGAASVRALDEGQSGVMVVLDPPAVTYVPLDQCTQRMKTVPPDCDTVLTARDLGISFGD
ncbi:MAG: ATP-dependent 6-phosphofructokinase [Deltaproteobacteria bacterium]|jgi:ATP-dependent phosphofructokinase / diphosphate-dependent phosphofructokinase|nr:ATP-dependent 6-phosphofructokinase [Deltaproteobacteria bacterium]